MKLNSVVRTLASVIVLSVSMTLAGLLWTNLTKYGLKRQVLAAFAAVLGICLAVAVYLLVSKYCKSRKWAIIIISVLLLLLVASPLSMLYPGKITYSCSGLTVYGIIPVPILDVIIGPNGWLRFRDKSHCIPVQEVQALLSPDVEVIVIGIGWNSEAVADAAIRDIPGREVHILPTPDAFKMFNKCVSEGKKVILIAHSTS
jgi:hypothetical protein